MFLCVNQRCAHTASGVSSQISPFIGPTEDHISLYYTMIAWYEEMIAHGFWHDNKHTVHHRFILTLPHSPALFSVTPYSGNCAKVGREMLQY